LHKRGLKDVKRRNRQVILGAVLEAGSLSRTEIAQRTSLAASTVTALTGELLAEELLVEAGTVVTAGRSRTELTVNPACGTIAVAEIGRKEVCVTCFDMMLKPIESKTLSRCYVSGNDLLVLLTNYLNSMQEKFPPLAGVGLLFQEDMRESDFRVIYSTGHASESITLRDALKTQFRVLIEEEYSIAYTVSNALSSEADPEVRNSAHISVGSRIRADVTLEGRGIPLRDDFCEQLATSIPKSPSGEAGIGSVMADTLVHVIAMLCMIFPLETVFLSGSAMTESRMIAEIHRLTGDKIPSARMPRLKFLNPGVMEEGSCMMARQMQRKVLTSQ